MSSQLLSQELAAAICRRAFGPEAELVAMERLGQGTYNLVYRLDLKGRAPVVLRVAPEPDTARPPDEQGLMRREHALRPYFAPVAALMPVLLCVDFTHQLIDRDYMLQNLIEGVRWEDAAAEFSQAESHALWRQFGEITRLIHDVPGETFGDPRPGRQFASWSEAIEYRLEQAVGQLRAAGLGAEAESLEAALGAIRSRRAWLDEIGVPRLLHGDLWLFNLLVRREAGGSRIVGVLDADRGGWGDPMADWTMFVLSKVDDEMKTFTQSFWSGYGAPERTPAADFRADVYEALHIGRAMAWAAREGDKGTLARGRRELPEVLRRLTSRA